MSGRLFVCATPIGNLEDASYRLIRILSEADVIAAEDTRRTRKLLTHYGIHAKLVSYHEANERRQVNSLVARISKGETVALVTDSGMPAISDPGYPLITACLRNGVRVEVIPGPSAVISALVVSGLPTARFAFEGFLPKKEGERIRRLRDLSNEDRTLVIFEASNRVRTTLSNMLSILGDRQVAVARELTKIHEEVLRGTISRVIAQLPEEELRGEVVLIVEGGERSGSDIEAAVAKARELIEQGLTKSEAASEAASASGLRKREIYERLIGR